MNTTQNTTAESRSAVAVDAVRHLVTNSEAKAIRASLWIDLEVGPDAIRRAAARAARAINTRRVGGHGRTEQTDATHLALTQALITALL